MIRAIETTYKGYRFRSRLEARYAVLFDALSLEWQYEPEGFQIEVGTETRGYLPDFFLPETETWVEVKGREQDLDYELLEALIDFGGQLPGIAESEGSTRGLLVLGPIPEPSSGWPIHPILQHRKGVWRSDARFGPRLDVKPYGQVAWPVEGGPLLRPLYIRYPMPYRVKRAYEAARSARFEHGESP